MLYISFNFRAVPIIVLPRCMEIMVNLKEARNAIDELLSAEMVTAGRCGNGQDEGKRAVHPHHVVTSEAAALEGTTLSK